MLVGAVEDISRQLTQINMNDNFQPYIQVGGLSRKYVVMGLTFSRRCVSSYYTSQS